MSRAAFALSLSLPLCTVIVAGSLVVIAKSLFSQYTSVYMAVVILSGCMILGSVAIAFVLCLHSLRRLESLICPNCGRHYFAVTERENWFVLSHSVYYRQRCAGCGARHGADPITPDK